MSAMSAVIRVKRKTCDEPLEALILNCKRRKTDSDEAEKSDDSVSAVLKFAGTIFNQDDNLAPHITKLSKIEAEESYKKHIPNITSKLRTQNKLDSERNRYKVVNCFRALKESDLEHLTDSELLTVVDIEAQALNDQKPVEKVDDENYVYDLYYAEDVNDMVIDKMVSVHPMCEELVYGSYRDNGRNTPSSNESSDDSNDENNYRNDYPDSDYSENSITLEDMRFAARNLDIDSISSEDGEGFVYSIDPEGAGFEEDIDLSDSRRYGEMYARYKARALHMKAENPNEDEDSDQSSNDFGYGEDGNDESYNEKSD